MNFLVVLVETLYWVLIIAILVRSVLSWIISDNSNPLMAAVYHITEPILRPIRTVLPSLGNFDLSPIVAILILVVVRAVILRIA